MHISQHAIGASFKLSELVSEKQLSAVALRRLSDLAKEMTVPGVEKAENIVAEWKLQSSQLTLMAMGGLKVAGEHARAAETL